MVILCIKNVDYKILFSHDLQNNLLPTYVYPSLE